MKFRLSKNPQPPKFGQKQCDRCGLWVSSITAGKDAGRKYNDNGTWHETSNGSCDPDPDWINKRKLRRAEWEAKNLIDGEDKREMRSRTPLYLRGRK